MEKSNAMFKKKYWIAIITSLLLSNYVSAAGDPIAGKTFSANCVSCHGNAGISPSPEVPNLAGQLPSYIQMRVDYFREDHQGDSLMHGVAKLLNNPKDIADVAAYYASLPRASYRSNDKKLAAKGREVYFGTHKCYMCHGDDGRGLLGSDGVPSPMLVGLSKTYIVKAMKDFQSQKRISEKGYMMNLIPRIMTDRDIDAVAAYLSTQ